MKHSKAITAVLLLLILATSCRKKVDISLDKNQRALSGKWTIDAINIRKTDTLGNQFSDTTFTGEGTIELLEGNVAASGTDGFFNEARFVGTCIQQELVAYFKTQAAGDPVTNGWSVFWDADPDGRRIQFWGVTGGGSLHKSVNISGGSGATELYYVLDESVYNRRTFCTWKIHKS